MRDREFLLWIADRLVLVHKEHPYMDYISKLVSIAMATDKEKRTPSTRNYKHDLDRI